VRGAPIGAPVILGVAGLHNSGKTTLLEVLIPAVIGAGFTVATVKHIAHGDLDIDKGGSDTHRHKRAGATVAAAVSDTEAVYFHGKAHTLEEVLSRLEQLGPFDLVLVEGYKGSSIPKIVVGGAQHAGRAAYTWNGEQADAVRIASGLIGQLRKRASKAQQKEGKQGR